MGRVKKTDTSPAYTAMVRTRFFSAREPSTIPMSMGVVGKPNLGMM